MIAVEEEELQVHQESMALAELTQSESKTLKVLDDASCSLASEFLVNIQSRMKQIKAKWFKLIDPIHQAHKRLCEARDNCLQPFEDVSTSLRSELTMYRAEAEKRRRVEQEAAEAELRRRLEEANKQRARDAEAFGTKEESVKVMAAPIVVPTIILPPAIPKTNGVSFRTVWKHRVVDESKIPREFLLVDVSKLTKYATAMKEGAKVDGVEFYPEQVLTARALA
jgi:hypothetical protein